MKLFLLAELVFVMWAALFAHFQIPLLKAFQAYVPKQNIFSKPMHRRGAMASFFVAWIIGIALLMLAGWKPCVFLPFAFFAIYKIVFDGVIGKAVYGSWTYIGTTSQQDRWLNEHFPHGDGGEVKFIVCLCVLIAVNIIASFSVLSP